MVKNKDSHNSSEIGTLLEHIDSKVSLIAEQYTGLNDKYFKLDKKVDSLTKRVDSVVDMVGAMKEGLLYWKTDDKNCQRT